MMSLGKFRSLFTNAFRSWLASDCQNQFFMFETDWKSKYGSISPSLLGDLRMRSGTLTCLKTLDSALEEWGLPSLWEETKAHPFNVLSCLHVQVKVKSVSRSVDSVWPHGLQPTRLLRAWDSPGKNTGVGYHGLLQGIFPTQGWNPGLLHCRRILYRLSHQGSPWCAKPSLNLI